MRKKKVLVPLDDTTFSLRVVPQVTELFDPDRYEITLLHVESVPSAVTVDDHVVIYADQETASRQAEGLAALQPYARSLEALGYTVTRLVRFGDPVSEIVYVVGEMDYDVIAMATHGRAGIDRILHGSVAQEVVNRVDRPVLLYHAASNNGNHSALGL